MNEGRKDGIVERENQEDKEGRERMKRRNSRRWWLQ
jgi:hypothetical protein